MLSAGIGPLNDLPKLSASREIRFSKKPAVDGGYWSLKS